MNVKSGPVESSNKGGGETGVGGRVVVEPISQFSYMHYLVVMKQSSNIRACIE